MTKTMNKASYLLAFVAAAILALALAAPAYAASITMNDSADGTVAAAGKTFNAYKVLDVTVSGTNYAYTIPAQPTGLKAALATKFNVGEKGANETDAAYEQRIIAAINTAGTANVEQAAKDLLDVATTVGIEPVVINGTTTAENLDLGYYVIKDATASGDNQKPVAAVALTTAAPDQTINVKASKPPLDKNIDEGATAGALDTGTDPDVKTDNHAIGDTVPYILTTKVPEMTGYTKYFFIVNDTLSKGLTFKNDVAIKVGTDTLVKDTDYTVTSTSAADGTTAVEIVFKDFYNNQKGNAGKDIVITYSATINDEAVIGVPGNPNKATLTYSDNPNITQTPDSGNPDKPAPGTAVGITPEKKTYTYVTGLVINKKDQNQKALAGAKFKLEGTTLNTVLVKTEVFSVDAEGTYYKLKDGTYTQTVPITDSGATGYNADLYESTDTKYKMEVQTSKVEKSATVQYEGTVGQDGVLTFDGLSAGDYTITELVAPEGYNLLTSPINITISWQAPDANSQTMECTWNVSGSNAQMTADGARAQVTVVNQAGSVLPSTGGMGTTIIYIIGGILIAVGAVVLITKRRASKENID